jgi:hypothetical protein
VGTGAPQVNLDTPSSRAIAQKYHFEAFFTFSQPNLSTSPLQKTPGKKACPTPHELTGLILLRIIRLKQRLNSSFEAVQGLL